MPLFSDKTYSSVTVKIRQLAQEDEHRGMESHLAGLIELIKIQPSTGPVEAARAIRKCVKYGKSDSERLRALEILEMLTLNAGDSIAPKLAQDDKLLAVLAGIIDGTGKTGEGMKFNKEVRSRTVVLAHNWHSVFQNKKGYLGLSSLYKPLKPTSQTLSPASHSRSASFSNSSGLEDISEELSSKSASTSSSRKPPPRPTTTSPYSQSSRRPWNLSEFSQREKKDKKRKKKKPLRVGGALYADPEYEIPQINYTKEEPRIRAVISDIHTHGTGLRNLLVLLPLGEDPLDDPKVAQIFEKCRSLRRKALRYLQFVGAGNLSTKKRSILEKDEEFLGALLEANEFLVGVFKQFDLRSGIAVDDNEEDDSDDLESYYTESDTSEEVRELELHDDEKTVDTISGNFSRIDFGSETELANPQKEAIEGVAQKKDSFDPFGDGNAIA